MSYNYGVGGNYWNNLQYGVNNAVFTPTPMPQTGLYGGNYSPSPYQGDFYGGNPNNQPFTPYPQAYPTPTPGSVSRQEALTGAEARLEQERAQINDPNDVRTKLIDGQLQQIEGAEPQVGSY